ncbi:DUF547 domain-containing protein [Flagellimonas sp. DF-77]|uniref:DUF547 domain-containing protein n=1 Tax=Flagellimonas algarum TaxID=3230298 RepID=UPI00339A919B
MKIHVFAVLAVLLLSCCKVKEAPLDKSPSPVTDFNTLSERFLERIKAGETTQDIQQQLAQTTLDELDAVLQTDAQRYAFWINVYNAYILAVLKENPELYQDRRSFFSTPQLTIAGEQVSFEILEHGILRKSQWSLGLGYVRKWLPGKFERKLRVDKRDYRIHFALNCGAKDCPPVAIYTPSEIDRQLQQGSERYLKATTDYDNSTKEVKVTALFSWFRGDFGGKGGTKKILESFDLIPTTKGIDIAFKNYDWTLDLDNFIDL